VTAADGDDPLRRSPLEGLWQDVRFAARSLRRRNPGLTAVGLLALALGIGANTAVFSVIEGVLLRPLPLPHADQLVVLLESSPSRGMKEMGGTPLNFLDWRRQNRVMTSLCAFRSLGFTLSGPGAEPEALAGGAVTGDFFRTLEASPLAGRLIGPADDRPGGEGVVVLGAELWRRRFGRDPAIVGRSILIDGRQHVVVGVAPQRLDFPNRSELWVPLALDYAKERRGAHYLGVLGRLRPGVNLARAQSEMSVLAARLAREYPEDKDWGVILYRLLDDMVEDIRPALLVLQLSVWVLTLIASANVAGLLLTRMSARWREIAVRAALGAGRRRLTRQLVMEGMILSVAGGLLGLVVAAWGVRALVAMNPGALPRAEEIHVNLPVLAYTVLVSLATGALCGLLPALALHSERLHEGLRHRTSAAAGGGRGRRLRGALVLTEVALATALVVAAGLLTESLLRLERVDPGFKPGGVVTARVRLPAERYPTAEAQGRFFERTVARVRALPGVEHAAVAEYLPLQGYEFALLETEDRRADPTGRQLTAHAISVTPDYFATMGIPLLAGRSFNERDDLRSPPVTIVSRSAAARLWPGKDPLGRRLSFGPIPSRPDAVWWQVVGVVGDVRDDQLAQATELGVYNPQRQLPSLKATFVVRGKGDPLRFLAPMRRAVGEIDPHLAFDRVSTLEGVVARTIAGNRVNTALLGLFAALALALAAIGVYGLVSSAVNLRVHEIGVRMALGASGCRVVWMVVREGMSLVAVGLSGGVIAAFLLSRLLAHQLYGMGAGDPLIWSGGLATLAAVALFANWLPARRCARVDPAEALRRE
jgi:putative ABC transport system permease protein